MKLVFEHEQKEQNCDREEGAQEISFGLWGQGGGSREKYDTAERDNLLVFESLVLKLPKSHLNKKLVTLSCFVQTRRNSSRLETRIKECRREERERVAKTQFISRNESKSEMDGGSNPLCTFVGRRLFFDSSRNDSFFYNPKDGDFNATRAKPQEIVVEARHRANVQIAGFSCVTERNTHRAI